jgi:hypothetical protein
MGGVLRCYGRSLISSNLFEEDFTEVRSQQLLKKLQTVCQVYDTNLFDDLNIRYDLL